MKFEKRNLVREEINFLASDKVVSFTTTVQQSKGEVIGNKKIVKAGTILPTNDQNAKGILLNDIDVTAGDAVGALMVEGYVLKDRLPQAPDPQAITALKKITFR